MDVWVIGDINYLTSVLNALAMPSNSGLFVDLIKVGLAPGVLSFFLEYLNRYAAGGGEGLPWGRFVLIFMLYGFSFGSTTTVHLNDTYTLKSQDVDNVPYGGAFAGNFLSKAAHEITIALKQAFILTHMTEFGFGSPLLTLTKGQAFFTGIETLRNSQIAKTQRDVSINSLTGSGSQFNFSNTSSPRPDAAQRIQERINQRGVIWSNSG